MFNVSSVKLCLSMMLKQYTHSHTHTQEYTIIQAFQSIIDNRQIAYAFYSSNNYPSSQTFLSIQKLDSK